MKGDERYSRSRREFPADRRRFHRAQKTGAGRVCDHGRRGFYRLGIVAALDDEGADTVMSDRMGASDSKWRNIAKCRLRDLFRRSR